MGRELKRVALDFDWPMGKVWTGFINPHNEQCEHCNGSGETAARRCLQDIAHLLLIAGADSLKGRNHPWMKEIYLDDRVPSPDMAELTGALTRPLQDWRMGHDAIDRWTATKKIIQAAGLDPDVWGICTHCEGHGQPKEVYALSEAWEQTEPPTGEGWQMWETVSDGSPVSPVFATKEAFVKYLIGQGYSEGAAEQFAEQGHAFSFAIANGQMYSNLETLNIAHEDETE
jgi:hypothetical protein